MARAPRKQITWKLDGTDTTRTIAREYFPDIPIDPLHREKIEKCLVLGSAFFLKSAMARRMLPPNYKEPPFPYLVETIPTSYPNLVASTGSLAIYIGTVRVEELVKRNKDIRLARVLRHSFIINGGRYLVTNLNLLDPVTQEPPEHT